MDEARRISHSNGELIVLSNLLGSVSDRNRVAPIFPSPSHPSATCRILSSHHSLFTPTHTLQPGTSSFPVLFSAIAEHLALLALSHMHPRRTLPKRQPTSPTSPSPSSRRRSRPPSRRPTRSFFGLFSKPKASPDDSTTTTPAPSPNRTIHPNLKLPPTFPVTVPLLSSVTLQSLDPVLFPQITTVSSYVNPAPGDAPLFDQNADQDDDADSNNFIEASSSASLREDRSQTFALPKHSHLTIQHSQAPPPHSSLPTSSTDFRKYTSIYSLPPSRLHTAESDASYYLPIIRTGATPFALLQVRASSPNTSHLRLLGGPTVSSESTSVVSAAILADIQSAHQTSNMLDQFSTLYEIHKTRAVSNYREKFDDHTLYSDDQIALRVMNDFPLSLNYNIDGATLSQDPTISLQTQHRLAASANTSSSTLGRVVATHLSQRKYPADPPRDFVDIQQRPKETTKVSKSTLPHAVHVVDYGELPPLTPGAFEPTSFSPLLPNFTLYPELFSEHFRHSCTSAQEYNQLRPLLRLSALLFSTQSLYPLVQRANEGHIKRIFSKLPPSHQSPLLAPFPSSLTPWYTMMKTIENVTLRTVVNPYIKDNIEHVLKLIESEYWVDSPVHLRASLKPEHASTSTANIIDNLHPTLQAWLLPFLYHTTKPGGSHPHALGHQAPNVHYRDWGSNATPNLQFEAQSLQWVPLVDLLHQDSNLRPRFNGPTAADQAKSSQSRPRNNRHNDLASSVLAPEDRNVYAQNERLDHVFDVPETVSHDMMEDTFRDQGPSLDLDDFNQLQAVQEKYEMVRPDLVFAYQKWHHYYRNRLNQSDRGLLHATSHLPPHNTPYISEFGQLLTTSVGNSYPIRHSHQEMLTEVGMKLYLGNIISDTRTKAFKTMGEGRIMDFAKTHPAMLHHMGLSIAELRDFAPKHGKHVGELHRLYFDPTFTGIANYETYYKS